MGGDSRTEKLEPDELAHCRDFALRGGVFRRHVASQTKPNLWVDALKGSERAASRP